MGIRSQFKAIMPTQAVRKHYFFSGARVTKWRRVHGELRGVDVQQRAAVPAALGIGAERVEVRLDVPQHRDGGAGGNGTLFSTTIAMVAVQAAPAAREEVRVGRRHARGLADPPPLLLAAVLLLMMLVVLLLLLSWPSGASTVAAAAAAAASAAAALVATLLHGERAGLMERKGSGRGA